LTTSACAPFRRARVVENIKLDAAERQRVIDGIASNLTESYVYPEVGQKMIDAVRAHQKSGDYDKIVDGDAFAFSSPPTCST
jgi:hypothetical protein